MGALRPQNRLILVLGLILLLVVGGVAWWWLTPGTGEITLPAPAIPELPDYVYPTYELAVKLDPEERFLGGECTVTYTNNEGVPLAELYFHLYPNAPLFAQATRDPGSLAVEEVRIGGELGVWEQDGTLLKVTLPEPLLPGEETRVEIPFRVTIPPMGERFGVREGIFSLGNWYPILAVYDGEWRLDPYYEIGDPFYSDVALYRVTLQVPRRYAVAATGNLVEVTKLPFWRKRLYFETGPVRDFALAVSSCYRIARQNVGGVLVQSFYPRGREGAGKLALSTAAEALAFFQELFGPYPYGQFTVAASGFFAGGMEYPNLVFISQDLYGDRANEMLEYLVVHETAHQWWYGLVGNDQVREPWLDEGLADFSTRLFYEYRRPEAGGELAGSLQDLYELYRDGAGAGTIRRPLWEFDSELEYNLLVYGKGGLVFSELRELLGDDVFFPLLREYAQKYRYRHATINDFIDFCEGFTGMELGRFFYQRLETT